MEQKTTNSTLIVISFRFAVATLAFLLTGVAVNAQPIVSQVTGEFDQLSLVQVEGSGFGRKAVAAPLIWANFSTSLSPSPLGRIRSWSVANKLVWSNEGPQGSGAARAADGGGNWSLGVDYSYWTADGQKSYLFRRQRKNFLVTSQTQNWKTIRLWPKSSNYPNLYTAAHNGRIFVEDIGTESGFYGDLNASTLDWVTEEFIIRASSQKNVKDGRLVFRTDGREMASGTLITRSDRSPDYMGRYYVVHGILANRSRWSPSWSDNNRLWVDEVYVDVSWARVLIGNAPTYSACTEFSPQIPAAWSDDSVTVRFNSGPFRSGGQVYLYVVNEDGEVNNAGYPLTIGSVEEPEHPVGPGDSLPGDFPGSVTIDAAQQTIFNPGHQALPIRFELDTGAAVRIRILDREGETIRTVVNEQRNAGIHTVYWDGRNDAGSAVVSGIYFVATEAGGTQSRKKIVLVR